MPLARIFALLALVTAGPSVAETSKWVALGLENPECTCRSGGANLALGAQICLATQNGMRLAECVMEQNVTSWKVGPLPCPEAQLRAFSPRRRS